MITLSILLDLMIHQAFAMEYFKAALYIPIIMDLMTVDAQQRLKRARCILINCNLVYYAVVAPIIILLVLEPSKQLVSQIWIWGLFTL